MNFSMPPLIFIIIWLIGVSIGVVWPKKYLPLIKWQAKIWNKMTGLGAQSQSDEVISKKIRIWHSILLVFGLIMLFLVLTGKAK